MKVNVLKLDNTTSNIDVDLELSGLSANVSYDLALINRVKNQAEKQGTKHAKTRSEIRTGTKKPYRQKGTGNARQGSTKGPHFVGGGVAHGPMPDTSKLKLNKKYKSVALKKIVAAKLQDDSLKFVELGSDKKALRTFASALPKSLLIYSKDSKELVRSIQNVPGIELLEVESVSPTSIVNYAQVLIDVNSKEEFEKILKK